MTAPSTLRGPIGSPPVYGTLTADTTESTPSRPEPTAIEPL